LTPLSGKNLQTIQVVPFSLGKGWWLGGPGRTGSFYLTHNVFKAVSQKSIPTKIRQLALFFSRRKG
jgi:hypothetical protein